MAAKTSTPFSSRKITWSGHRSCTEGAVPSGLRKRQPVSAEDGMRLRQRVEVDYSKLGELCLHQVPQHTRADPEESFQRFISSYQSLFCRRPARKTTRSTASGRRHTCSLPSEITHDVASYTEAIHGRDVKTQAVIDTKLRLQNILDIVKKLPLRRSEEDVKILSQHLSHFPALLPDVSRPVMEGMAARSQLETLPKGGFSLPEKGGVYLVLQGSVEKLDCDKATAEVVSTQLYPGSVFGKMEEHFFMKLSYPVYITHEACSLMRLTVFDYNIVLQKCKAEVGRERQAVVHSCQLLTHVSPAVLSKLAKDITWESIPANKLLLSEGEVIQRVGFIQSGVCCAVAKVPQTSKAQVRLGELGPGTCVGEVLLLGEDVQPYQVETTTRVRIGWVPAATAGALEVKKHILPENRLAIPILSKQQLRDKYSNKLIQLQWNKIKSDIVHEVMSELQMRPGQGKWQHNTTT